MAGSYASTGPTRSKISDQFLARIEGLKLLAKHLDEPVVIFSPQMELVYANSAADIIAKDCPLASREILPPPHSRDVQVSPCNPCPASNLFQSSERVLVAPSCSVPFTDFPAACPFPRAVPLNCEGGVTHFAVLMGARGSDSVVTVPQAQTSSEEASQPRTPLEESSLRKIIGESEPIQQLVEMIQLVAASEATVLIQGESGTGKELVAKTIHALSRRQAQPFIVVECSALPQTLLESELFGHVRGAFTGAVADRKGLFEEAEGGTIFLDEIADTTPAFQARLLRVLQEGEIKPVGSNQSIKVNVRIISAGNTPLEELVEAKRFRKDLYYRLAVLPLNVPSLRERQEDIPLLVNHFLDRSNHEHGRKTLTVASEALLALKQYAWPGNVRELENVIERAVVTCPHSPIRITDFFGNQDPPPGVNGDLSSVSKAARESAERDRILQALSDTQGDKTRAARLLKISRSNLYNKLRTYRLL